MGWKWNISITQFVGEIAPNHLSHFAAKSSRRVAISPGHSILCPGYFLQPVSTLNYIFFRADLVVNRLDWIKNQNRKWNPYFSCHRLSISRPLDGGETDKKYVFNFSNKSAKYSAKWSRDELIWGRARKGGYWHFQNTPYPIISVN